MAAQQEMKSTSPKACQTTGLAPSKVLAISETKETFSVKASANLQIINKNLFFMPTTYALAHCVSLDYKMSAGIAATFKGKYPVLKRLAPGKVGTTVVARSGNRVIFNLITKRDYYGKPTLNTVELALRDMKSQCVKHGVTKIAMPKIATGLDKLEWEDVSRLIYKIFNGSDIDITICEYTKREEYKKRQPKQHTIGIGEPSLPPEVLETPEEYVPKNVPLENSNKLTKMVEHDFNVWKMFSYRINISEIPDKNRAQYMKSPFINYMKSIAIHNSSIYCLENGVNTAIYLPTKYISLSNYKNMNFDHKNVDSHSKDNLAFYLDKNINNINTAFDVATMQATLHCMTFLKGSKDIAYNTAYYFMALQTAFYVLCERYNFVTPSDHELERLLSNVPFVIPLDLPVAFEMTERSLSAPIQEDYYVEWCEKSSYVDQAFTDIMRNPMSFLQGSLTTKERKIIRDLDDPNNDFEPEVAKSLVFKGIYWMIRPTIPFIRLTTTKTGRIYWNKEGTMFKKDMTLEDAFEWLPTKVESVYQYRKAKYNATGLYELLDEVVEKHTNGMPLEKCFFDVIKTSDKIQTTKTACALATTNIVGFNQQFFKERREAYMESSTEEYVQEVYTDLLSTDNYVRFNKRISTDSKFYAFLRYTIAKRSLVDQLMGAATSYMENAGNVQAIDLHYIVIKYLNEIKPCEPRVLGHIFEGIGRRLGRGIIEEIEESSQVFTNIGVDVTEAAMNNLAENQQVQEITNDINRIASLAVGTPAVALLETNREWITTQIGQIMSVMSTTIDNLVKMSLNKLFGLFGLPASNMDCVSVPRVILAFILYQRLQPGDYIAYLSLLSLMFNDTTPVLNAIDLIIKVVKYLWEVGKSVLKKVSHYDCEGCIMCGMFSSARNFVGLTPRVEEDFYVPIEEVYTEFEEMRKRLVQIINDLNANNIDDYPKILAEVSMYQGHLESRRITRLLTEMKYKDNYISSKIENAKRHCLSLLTRLTEVIDNEPVFEHHQTSYQRNVASRKQGTYRAPKDFAQILAGLENNNDLLEDELTPPEETTAEPEPEAEEQAPPGWLCWLKNAWEKMDPKAIGVLGTAFALAIGVKADLRTLYKEACVGIINVMKNFHWLSCGGMAIGKIFTCIYGAMSWAMEQYRKWKNPEYQAETAFLKEVEEWVDKANVCAKGIIEPAYLANPQVGLWYQAVKTQGYAIRSKMSRLTSHLQIKIAVDAAWRQVMSVSNVMDALMKFQCGRYEPFHIQVFGAPGIGKTNVQSGLVKEIGPIIASNLNTYPINDKLEYLDNYCGQEIATWDDTHLEREDENYVAKILLLSGGSVILPMADLADKGKPIDFKLVLSNTNVPFPTFINVAENKALWRRRILIKSELNPMKLSNAAEVTGTDNEYLQNLLFTVLDPTDEGQVPLSRGLAGLVWGDLIKYLTIIAKRHDIVEKKRAMEQGTYNMRKAMEEFKKTWTNILAQTLPPSSTQIKKMGILYEELAQDLHKAANNPNSRAAAVVLEQEMGIQGPSPRSDEQIPQEWFNNYRTSLTLTTPYNSDMETYMGAPYQTYENEADYMTRTNLTRDERSFETGQYYISPGTVGWNVAHGHTPIEPDLAVGRLMPKILTPLPEMEVDEGCFVYSLQEMISGDNFQLPDSVNHINIDPMTTTPIIHIDTNQYRASTVKNVYIKTNIQNPTQEQLIEWYIIMEALLSQQTFSHVRNQVTEAYGYSNYFEAVLRDFRRRQNPWRARMKEIFMNIAKSISFDAVLDTLRIIALILYIIIFLLTIGTLLTASMGPRVYHHEGVKRLATVVPRNTASYHHSKHLTEMSMRHAYRVHVHGNVMKNGRQVGTTRSGNLVGLRGNLFTTCRHLFTGLLDDQIEIEIYDNLNLFAGKPQLAWERVTIRRSRDIKEIEGRDAVVVCLPTFRSTRDGVNQFVTEEDLSLNMLDGSTHCAVAFGELQQAIYLESIELRNFSMRYNEQYANDFGVYKNEKVYAYTMDADAIPSGHSGAVVFHNNSLVQRGFVGIIGASDKTRTLVIPLTQEDLIKTMKEFDIVKQVVVEEITGSAPTEFDKELYDVTPVVGLYYPRQHGQDRSKLVPTKFHKDIKEQSPYEPGILSDRDPRIQPDREHYAHIGINKFSKPQVFQDKEGIMQAAAELGKYHATLMPNVKFQSIYDSIAGSGKLGSTPLNLNKGSGLPWSHMSPDKGKKGFINRDEFSGQYNVHNLLLHNVKDILAQCENCTYPPKTYQMFYKDELVKTNKIYDSPKTRTIIMPALDVLVANGVLTGDICRQFKLLNITKSRIACGFNFESLQFNELVNWLKYHDTMIAFDVKNWDGSCPTAWSEAIANYYYHLYMTAYTARGEAFPAKMREVLFTFTIAQAHTTIVHDQVIFVVKHGLKSGERDTLVKNSLGHLIMDYYFYKNIMRRTKPHLSNINSYLDNVRTVTCGDDVLRGIKPELATLLSPEAYVEEYRAMGFDVTTANKDKNFRFENIYEVSFLQLNVRWDSERSVWAAKTSEKIFWNLLSWQRTTLPEMEQLSVNMYNACRAAWHRGREEYERLTSIIPILCAKYRIPFSVPEYDSIGSWIGSDVDQWCNGVNTNVEMELAV